MTDHSHMGGASGHNINATSFSVRSLFADFADFSGKAAAKFRSGTRALQLARMKSILAQMSDYQLSQVGITRSEISVYAESLMGRDSEL